MSGTGAGRTTGRVNYWLLLKVDIMCQVEQFTTSNMVRKHNMVCFRGYRGILNTHFFKKILTILFTRAYFIEIKSSEIRLQNP